MVPPPHRQAKIAGFCVLWAWIFRPNLRLGPLVPPSRAPQRTQRGRESAPLREGQLWSRSQPQATQASAPTGTVSALCHLIRMSASKIQKGSEGQKITNFFSSIASRAAAGVAAARITARLSANRRGSTVVPLPGTDISAAAASTSSSASLTAADRLLQPPREGEWVNRGNDRNFRRNFSVLAFGAIDSDLHGRNGAGLISVPPADLELVPSPLAYNRAKDKKDIIPVGLDIRREWKRQTVRCSTVK